MLMNVISWGSRSEPLRHLHGPPKNFSDALVQGLDLVVSITASSWEHGAKGRASEAKSQGQSRRKFIFIRLFSALKWALVLDLTHFTIVEVLSSPGHRSGQDGFPSTIYDSDLPLCWRYLKTCIISCVVATWLISALHIIGDLCTVTWVSIGVSPTRCPPSFHRPWLSTSISSFWGYRWHQWTRVTLLQFAGEPLGNLGLGRIGVVMGSLIASGIAHDVGAIRSPTPQAREGQGAIQFFTMMGVGIVLEHCWKTWTGRKVGGLVGWCWTMVWHVVWGNFYVDGGVRIGIFRIIPDIWGDFRFLRPSAALWAFLTK